jgi:hypothetical protein
MAPASDEEGEQLAHAEFWDERYAQADSETPTHEWFRSYGELEGFLDRRLFQVRVPESNPRLLHLGSGDSVSIDSQLPLTPSVSRVPLVNGKPTIS